MSPRLFFAYWDLWPIALRSQFFSRRRRGACTIIPEDLRHVFIIVLTWVAYGGDYSYIIRKSFVHESYCTRIAVCKGHFQGGRRGINTSVLCLQSGD